MQHAHTTDQDDRETVADRLRQMFEARDGLSKAGLARACNVSNTAVFNWLAGVHVPDDNKLRLCANYLGVDWDWLRTGRDTLSESGNLYLPPSTRAILERQGHRIGEFADRHPLIASLIFSGCVPTSTAEELLANIERRAQDSDTGVAHVAATGEVLYCSDRFIELAGIESDPCGKRFPENSAIGPVSAEIAEAIAKGRDVDLMRRIRSTQEIMYLSFMPLPTSPPSAIVLCDSLHHLDWTHGTLGSDLRLRG